MIKTRLAFTITLASLALAGCTMQNTTASPTAPPAPRVLNASSKADIDSAMPKVTVAGVVDTAVVEQNRLTIHFKDTQDSHFYAVVLSGLDGVNAAFGGDAAKAISGKAVHVSGQVVLYRGNPEIVISKPEQLTIDPGQ